ncbi:hypothetical protein E4U55_000867 [Claviceps digitariae]|nr:hypothetical protein E4U55_000867 [Claviceps digitariae]
MSRFRINCDSMLQAPLGRHEKKEVRDLPPQQRTDTKAQQHKGLARRYAIAIVKPLLQVLQVQVRVQVATPSHIIVKREPVTVLSRKGKPRQNKISLYRSLPSRLLISPDDGLPAGYFAKDYRSAERKPIQFQRRHRLDSAFLSL